MDLPIIGIFCGDNLPTLYELSLIEKFKDYPLVILNANNVEPTDCLVLDGVDGTNIPEKYVTLPTADEVVAKYHKAMSNVGEPVGGQAPVDRNTGKETVKVEEKADKLKDAEETPPKQSKETGFK